MKFDNVYWDAGLMEPDHRQPSILAIGDSWFWYPFPGGSLLNQLGPMVKTKDHVILAYGYNGAEAYDYVHGKYVRQIDTALRLHGRSLSAVFISGGGNDFAGLNDLRPMLLKDCSNCGTAAGCFRDKSEAGSLGWLLDKVEKSYATLVDKIIGATWQTTLRDDKGRLLSADGPTRIIVHDYDYAPVTGTGVFGHDSTWLKPAFEAARVPEHLRDDCIRLLIDRFAAMLQSLVERYPGRVFLVDSRGALRREDWANELHPNKAGFARIAERWRPVLREQGLAV